MERIYGATTAQNGIVRVGAKWVIFYGCHTDENGSTYEYRHTFDHKPTLDEVKAVITQQINADCQDRISGGFVYAGKKIWLSAENQRNYGDWYAVRSTLEFPIRIRVGDVGAEEYLELGTSNALTIFYKATVDWIRRCVNECWEEKDTIDWSVYDVAS